MDLMSRDPQADYPMIAALAAAFTLAHDDDEAAARGAQKAVRIYRTAPVLAFDGVELRVRSEETPDAEYVTDGESCTCPARSHAWCKHRILFRLLLALASLRGPAALRAATIEQLVDVDDAEPLAPADWPAPWESDPDYLTHSYQPHAGRPRRIAETPRQKAEREVAELFAA
jgi:hypothetical protein